MHVLALALLDKLGARAFNMGNGAEYSNSRVVEAARQVTGKNIPVVPSPRHPGDPARLVAGLEHLRSELGWMPRYPDLTTMVETAWRWRQRHPRGYEAK